MRRKPSICCAEGKERECMICHPLTFCAIICVWKWASSIATLQPCHNKLKEENGEILSLPLSKSQVNESEFMLSS